MLEILFTALVSVLALPVAIIFCVRALARSNFFFTEMDLNVARYIEMFGQLRHILIVRENGKLDLITIATAIHNKLKWLDWFSKPRHVFGGVYWIGIPPITTIREFLWPRDLSRDTSAETPALLGTGQPDKVSVSFILLRDHYVEFASPKILTKDGAEVEAKANLHFRIKDPLALYARITDLFEAVRNLYESLLFTVVGSMTLDECLSLRRHLREKEQKFDWVNDLKKDFISQVKKWGMEVLDVALEDITPVSKRVSEGMEEVVIASRKAEAIERLAEAEKRRRIQEAVGEQFRIRRVLSQAARIPGGREMFTAMTMAEMAQGPSNTIIVSAPDLANALSGAVGPGGGLQPGLKQSLLQTGAAGMSLDQLERLLKRHRVSQDVIEAVMTAIIQSQVKGTVFGKKGGKS